MPSGRVQKKARVIHWYAALAQHHQILLFWTCLMFWRTVLFVARETTEKANVFPLKSPSRQTVKHLCMDQCYHICPVHNQQSPLPQPKQKCRQLELKALIQQMRWEMRKKSYMFPRKSSVGRINPPLQQNSFCLSVLRILEEDKPCSGMELSAGQHLVQWQFTEQSS